MTPFRRGWMRSSSGLPSMRRAWHPSRSRAAASFSPAPGKTIELSWDYRLQLEIIARRAPVAPPLRPAAELIATAAKARGLSEHEDRVIDAARNWIEKLGYLPAGLRQELDRIINLRAS
jgi:hypothetical protein